MKKFMNIKCKKTFSVLLIACLLFGMLPMNSVQVVADTLDATDSRNPYERYNAAKIDEDYGDILFDAGTSPGINGELIQIEQDANDETIPPNIGYIKADDWVMYKDIDFKDGAVLFEAGVSANTADGEIIDVRLDSEDGPVIGTISATPTGEWQAYVFQTCEVTKEATAGIHDVYLVFKQDGFNIRWWQFYQQEPKRVTKVTLSSKTLDFDEPSGSKKLTATLDPVDATNQKLIWTSDKPNVATVAADGTVTAKAGGTARITVTAEDASSTVLDTCTVTVKQLVTGITINPNAVSLEQEEVKKLSASVLPSNATNRTVKWTSSNPDVATVAETDGTVTAIKVGTTTITATANDESGKAGTCEITVTPKVEPTVLVESVAISPKALNIDLGKTEKLGVAVTPDNVSNKTVIWTTSDDKVVTVSADGTLTAKAVGTAIITATAQDESGKSDTCTVTVNLAKNFKITYVLNGGKNKNNPLTYNNGATVTFENPSRAKYLFSGWYTDSSFKSRITSIKEKDITVYAKWAKVKVDQATIKSLNNKKSKQAGIKLKKVSGAKEYQLLYAQNAKFSKNKKTALLKNISGNIKKLKKGKTYYFKARAFKLDSTGMKVYGKYSKVKKLSIKK